LGKEARQWHQRITLDSTPVEAIDEGAKDAAKRTALDKANVRSRG
jgi:hypothetical protein